LLEETKMREMTDGELAGAAKITDDMLVLGNLTDLPPPGDEAAAIAFVSSMIERALVQTEGRNLHPSSRKGQIMAAEKPVVPRGMSKRSNTIAQDAAAKSANAAQSSPEAAKKGSRSIRPFSRRRRLVTFLMPCESAISPRRTNGRASLLISRVRRLRNRRSVTRADGSSPPARATKLCAISLPSLAIAGGHTSMLPAVRRSEGQRGSKPVAKVWKYGDIGRANGICRSWTECGAMLVVTASPCRHCAGVARTWAGSTPAR
jgi:hypothetical protein